jgi:hypothetical protein
MICPSGDAVSESKLIDESALHSDIAGGAHASHANCVSSQTDNAARATSAEMKKLKGAELAAAKALVDAHAAVPANMQHAVDCWLKLTPAQQDDAYEMHGLGCTGHSANLTTDDSHKHSESAALTTNMVHDRAARVIQRLRKAPLRVSRTQDARTELTAAELRDGLRDRYVLGALRARSFVDVAFTTLIFFTHSGLVTILLSLFHNCARCNYYPAGQSSHDRTSHGGR